MTPEVVVDIGNSRMKWGACRDGRVVEVIRLPLDAPSSWETALAKLPPPRRDSTRKWAAASVNPPALRRFLEWAQTQGRTAVIGHHAELPIQVNVDEPEKVGLDRLFGAVAARSMTPAGAQAITVDMGTAVTVNLVDEQGIFQGGAIMPGPRLMARALNHFTAKLPFVELEDAAALDVPGPGKNTTAAIRLGLECAFTGGVAAVLAHFARKGGSSPVHVYLTGGASHLFEHATRASPAIASQCTVPTLVLEGIRIAAETLP